MHHRTKLILTALGATLLLALGIGGASAGRLSINEPNTKDIWNKALGGTRTNLRFSDSSAVVACPVTLSSSFVERTIKKETLIRQSVISHAEIEGERCEGGTATIRSETLPWEGRYRSFGGTLPRIQFLPAVIIRATAKIREAGGLECEVATEVNHPAVLITGSSSEATETGLETTGEPENITAERANGIPLGGSFLCSFGGEGHISGVGLVRNLPATSKTHETLI